MSLLRNLVRRRSPPVPVLYPPWDALPSRVQPARQESLLTWFRDCLFAESLAERKGSHAGAWLRRPLTILVGLAVSTVPVTALAEDAPQQAVESGPVKEHRNPRSIPLIGAGHATIFEVSVSDTRSALLSHSYGVGAFGVISAVPEANVERASLARVARFMLDMHAAGGQSGFDGVLAVDFGHGTRWPAMGHGLMVRGGADLKLAGNHQYYFSALDAPTIDAGYQHMGFSRVVEVSFRSSLLWDGRYRVDQGPTKNLPTTLGWGGLFEAGAPPLWASFQFLHGAGLSRVETSLCSTLGSTWSLCTRLTHVTDGWPLGDSVRHLTVGSMGVGVTMPKG